MSDANSSSATDLNALKARQQLAWSAGNYAVVGVTLQLVGENLCEALDLGAGARVLDVAAGNGNATLAAARRGAVVTSTDYVPALLDMGRARAQAEGFDISFRGADAEALPFPDEEFDAVLSTFGAMFTPNQEQCAAELFRVCRTGGKIGLANWTPDGFIGQLFKNIGAYIPPPPGVKPPSLWGTEDRLSELFPGTEIHVTRKEFAFRYLSADHWLEVFRAWYGPLNKAFAALSDEQQENLAQDLRGLADRFNRAEDGTLKAMGSYLEVVILKG